MSYCQCPCHRQRRNAAGAAVVSEAHCTPASTTLMLRLQRVGQGLTAMGADGRVVFTQTRAPPPLPPRHLLLSDAATGAQLCLLHKSFTGSSWQLLAIDGAPIALVKPSRLSMTSAASRARMQVFFDTTAAGGAAVEDVLVAGDARRRRFTITQWCQRHSGASRVLATVARRASNRLQVHLEPGADAAFVCALAYVCCKVYDE